MPTTLRIPGLYTHRLTRGPRLSWEAWGSIFTVTLKEKQVGRRPCSQHPETSPQNWDTKKSDLPPFLLFLQGGQLSLGVHGFQEDPRRR